MGMQFECNVQMQASRQPLTRRHSTSPLRLNSFFGDGLKHPRKNAPQAWQRIADQKGAMGWMAICLLALSHAHTTAYSGAHLASPPAQPVVALITRPRFSHILNRQQGGEIRSHGGNGPRGSARAVSGQDVFLPVKQSDMPPLPSLSSASLATPWLW